MHALHQFVLRYIGMNSTYVCMYTCDCVYQRLKCRFLYQLTGNFIVLTSFSSHHIEVHIPSFAYHFVLIFAHCSACCFIGLFILISMHSAEVLDYTVWTSCFWWVTGCILVQNACNSCCIVFEGWISSPTYCLSVLRQSLGPTSALITNMITAKVSFRFVPSQWNCTLT